MSTDHAAIIEQMVWAHVARAETLDDDPEDVIARTVAAFADGRYPGGLAAESGVPSDPQVLDAAAWAGRARWALIRRDDAIRAAVAGGASKRSVAAAVGLSPPGVDGVLGRADAANRRW